MEDQTKKEQGQVTQQLAILGDELERLHCSITNLGECLSPILRDVPETKDAEELERDLVPLADRIKDQVVRAECASGRLLGIMARLEL